jgi:hypothetical protein
MAEVLFIDWLQTVCLLRVETRGQRMHYEGPFVLFHNGHATLVTPRVIAYAGFERIIIVQLVALVAPDITAGRVCLRNLQDIQQKGKHNKGIERRNLEDLLRYSGILQIHYHSIGALEFHPRGIPAQ